MKKLSNLHEALVFQLRGLYNAERKLQKSIPPCSTHITSGTLKVEIDTYNQSSGDKLIKLERAFNYLMEEPKGRKNKVMREMIGDTRYILNLAPTDEMRDVVLAACIQNINHYKIAGYKTALAFAIELELSTVADLLHEILEWEKEMSTRLTAISLNEIFNKAI